MICEQWLKLAPENFTFRFDPVNIPEITGTGADLCDLAWYKANRGQRLIEDLQFGAPNLGCEWAEEYLRNDAGRNFIVADLGAVAPPDLSNITNFTAVNPLAYPSPDRQSYIQFRTPGGSVVLRLGVWSVDNGDGTFRLEKFREEILPWPSSTTFLDVETFWQSPGGYRPDAIIMDFLWGPLQRYKYDEAQFLGCVVPECALPPVPPGPPTSTPPVSFASSNSEGAIFNRVIDGAKETPLPYCNHTFPIGAFLR